MTDFVLATASAKEVWNDDFYVEYVRTNPFMPYMGKSKTSIIQIKEELTGQAGAAVHFAMVMRLRGAGVQDGTALYGSEDVMPNYSDCVRTRVNRNAVMITEDQSYKTELDLYNAARDNLVQWAAEKLRDDVITQLGSVIVKGGGSNGEDTSVALGTATAGQKDLNLDNNVDRYLFGTNNSNISTTSPAGGATRSFSNSCANVAAGQILSAAVLNKARTLARKAGAASGTMHIRPFKNDATAGREYYVLFVGSEGFRDLSADAAIVAANLNARGREGAAMDDNPLFQSGDLIYNGIIIREVPEIATIGNIGASSAPLAQAFLCGQGAVAVAWSKRPNARRQDFDYGHRLGVGISEIRGQKLLSFNGVKNGVVTLVHSAPADA